MAKVTGPLMSFSASGSLAGAMVFSNSKGRPYVRQLVIPSNPNTNAQQGVRASMKSMNILWAVMTIAAKATWAAAAAVKNVSTWNAFVARNQSDAAIGEAPQRQDPAEASVPPSIPTAIVDSVAGNQVTITANEPATGNTFGVALWISPTTGFTPASANLKQVVAGTATPGSPMAFTVSNLDVGTYYYRLKGFDFAGEWGTTSAEGSFVVV